MSTKHTPGPLKVAVTYYHQQAPGPWGVYRGGAGRSAFGGELVAMFNSEEDAKRFTAVSDLLEALQATYRHLRSNADATVEASDLYNAVCAAIAKATR